MIFPLTHAELKEIGLRLDLKTTSRIEQIGDSHYQIMSLEIKLAPNAYILIKSNNKTGQLFLFTSKRHETCQPSQTPSISTTQMEKS